MTATQFAKKYGFDGSTPTVQPFSQVNKMQSVGPGVPGTLVYAYNPLYCVVEECASDLAMLLGPINGNMLNVTMGFPNGPSGLFYDSGMVALYSLVGGWPWNAGFAVSWFTHGVDPDQVLSDLRNNLSM